MENLMVYIRYRKYYYFTVNLAKFELKNFNALKIKNFRMTYIKN
jgi:hypothetical protein